VADGAVVQLPFITWGGDLATILANGGQRNTAAGAFAEAGLGFKLVREDVFSKQVEAYLSGQSPYLRGTLAMLNMAAPLTEADPRTKMKVIQQLTWSVGGDAMVVKGGIRGPKDLRGKTIALQAYGPHVDYLAKVLSDAGLSMKDVKLRWTKDLTGTDQTPVAAFRTDEVDAAMVIIPDAMALSSQGSVGTGAEQSVKGARILLSSKTASRVIADVYAVRTDYYEAHPEKVKKFSQALFKAQGDLARMMKDKDSPATKAFLRSAAELLLDSPDAAGDAGGMYGDAEFVGVAGNKKFFQDPNFPRRFQALNHEVQTAFAGLGLIGAKVALEASPLKFSELGAGQAAVEAPRFDPEKVAKVVAQKQEKGNLAGGELYSFEILFGPNENTFSEAEYKDAFDKVIQLAATYGGALITIEGHSDPMGYLRKKKEGESPLVLGRVKQSAKNLSLSRANAVKESLLKYAKKRDVAVDDSQLALVGHGIEDPKTGICAGDPCSPKTEKDWKSNMRVEFRILQVEAEESVFKPL
jgi:outer membrane protein OmpA-like peptidoglycan-associated protein